MSRVSSALVAVVGLLVVPVASAQITFEAHFDPNSFYTAASGLTLETVDFEGIAVPQQFASADSTSLPGYVPNGIAFTAPPSTQSNDVAIVNVDGSNTLFSNFTGDYLQVDFAPGVTAAGSDVFTLFGISSSVLVTVRDPNDVVTSVPVAIPSSGAAFFGITVSAGEIVQIQYDSGGDIEVVDNYVFGGDPPPIADCGGNIFAEATSSAGALVQLDGSASFDPLGDPITFHWSVSDLTVLLDDPAGATPSGVFPIGVTTATLTVEDGKGGVGTCDVEISVEDTTPPEIKCKTSRRRLWIPNHGMRRVKLFVCGTDAVSDSSDIEIISALLTSSEPDDAPGFSDGVTTGDVNGADGYAATVDVTGLFAFNPNFGPNGAWMAEVELRAERDRQGDGRTYTLDVIARDASGLEASASCVVVVPRVRLRCHH